MRNLQLVLIAAVILLSLLLFAGASQPPAKIGVIVSDGDQETLLGLTIALQAINQRRDRQGAPRIALVLADDQGDPDIAASKAARLVGSEQVLALLGTSSSDATVPVAAMAEAADTPLLMTWATADALTDQGYRWVFRLPVPSNRFCDQALGYWQQQALVQQPERTLNVAILYESSVFGRATAMAAAQACGRRGLNVVAYANLAPQVTVDSPAATHSRRMAEIRSVLCEIMSPSTPQGPTPDLVFLASNNSSNALAIMQVAAELIDEGGPIGQSLERVTFMAGEGAYAQPSFAYLTGTNESIVVISQWASDSCTLEGKEFTQRYKHAYQQHPPDARGTAEEIPPEAEMRWPDSSLHDSCALVQDAGGTPDIPMAAAQAYAALQVLDQALVLADARAAQHMAAYERIGCWLTSWCSRARTAVIRQLHRAQSHVATDTRTASAAHRTIGWITEKLEGVGDQNQSSCQWQTRFEGETQALDQRLWGTEHRACQDRRLEIRKALEDQSTNSVVGPVRFDENGDNTGHPVYLVNIVEQQFSSVAILDAPEQAQASSTDPVSPKLHIVQDDIPLEQLAERLYTTCEQLELANPGLSPRVSRGTSVLIPTHYNVLCLETLRTVAGITNLPIELWLVANPTLAGDTPLEAGTVLKCPELYVTQADQSLADLAQQRAWDVSALQAANPGLDGVTVVRKGTILAAPIPGQEEVH